MLLQEAKVLYAAYHLKEASQYLPDEYLTSVVLSALKSKVLPCDAEENTAIQGTALEMKPYLWSEYIGSLQSLVKKIADIEEKCRRTNIIMRGYLLEYLEGIINAMRSEKHEDSVSHRPSESKEARQANPAASTAKQTYPSRTPRFSKLFHT